MFILKTTQALGPLERRAGPGPRRRTSCTETKRWRTQIGPQIVNYGRRIHTKKKQL